MWPFEKKGIKGFLKIAMELDFCLKNILYIVASQARIQRARIQFVSHVFPFVFSIMNWDLFPLETQPNSSPFSFSHS